MSVLPSRCRKYLVERAIALGVSGGVNYQRDRVSNAILEMSNGGVDMVIDSVGEASWGESLRSLRRGGRLVTCGATTGSNPPADLQRLFIRQLEIYGSTGGSLSEFRDPAQPHGAVGDALRALGNCQRHSVNVTVRAVKCDKNVRRHLRVLHSMGLDVNYRLPSI